MLPKEIDPHVPGAVHHEPWKSCPLRLARLVLVDNKFRTRHSPQRFGGWLMEVNRLWSIENTSRRCRGSFKFAVE